jgi:signal peptidase I
VRILFIFLAANLLLLHRGCSGQSLQKFKVPSGANEPTIKKGSYIYVSNLLKPNRFDFICFKSKNPQMGEYTAVFRLCGLEGDTVEIKEGDLYVNGPLADKTFNLMNQYVILKSEFAKIVDSVDINSTYTNSTNDSVYIVLSSAFVQRNKIKSGRVIIDKSQEDKEIRQIFSKRWNQDHFGPVIVPANCYFVLGDNRHQAMDSRYLGFIPKEDFVATVFAKK